MNKLPHVEATFADALAAHGLMPPEIVADGRIHRFDGAADRRHQHSAWYVLYANGELPAGAFGDWKTGLSEKWHAAPGRPLSDTERRTIHKHVHAARAAAADERQRVRTRAATAARRLWERADAADDSQPYCLRKRVKPLGLRTLDAGRTLMVPLFNPAGELVNVQFIAPDGTKRFLRGGEVAGCTCLLGDEPADDGLLLIGEGFATCASAHAATGSPVVVAFNAGNLPAAAQSIRATWPRAKVVLLADDDADTPGNPGLTKARAAARTVGGALAVPCFGERRPAGATDFNDLHQHAGLDAVVAQIRAAADLLGQPDKADAEAAANDSGHRDDDDATVTRLAALSPMQYDRVRRAEAKCLGVQVSTLDRLVSAARDDGGDEQPFAEVEPWPDPVDGAALLSELTATIRRFVVCDPAIAHAAALWIVMTWLMDSVDVAPLAAITSPEKRCGKSQMLTLIGRLSCRPIVASNITSAALFRAIEAWRPTLLIDEADTFLRDNEELRGLLNCGHTRDSAYVVRVVGDNFDVKRFGVWGAKAVAGIGKLSDTLADRSIVFGMRRKLAHEHADKLRHAEPDLIDRLASKLARWSDDNRDAVRAARPALPDALHDRAADNWEPLMQIAAVAGGAWPESARRAALVLSKVDGDNDLSIGAELLADIRTVYERWKVQRISMSDLLNALCADEEAPWKTWNKGREMTARQLGRKLADFGIRSQALKIDGMTAKGFKFEQFADAFDRYLSSSPVTPLSSVTQLPANAGAGFPVTDGQLRDQPENASVTAKPLPDKGSNQVTDETGGSGKKNDPSWPDEDEKASDL